MRKKRHPSPYNSVMIKAFQKNNALVFAYGEKMCFFNHPVVALSPAVAETASLCESDWMRDLNEAARSIGRSREANSLPSLAFLPAC